MPPTLNSPEDRTKEWLKLLSNYFESESILLKEAIHYGNGVDYLVNFMTKTQINDYISELKRKKDEAEKLLLPYKVLVEEFYNRIMETERHYQSLINLTENDYK